MNNYDSAFAQELAARLDEELKRVYEGVANGSPRDYTEYRARVATIQAYSSVKMWLKDIERGLNS